MDSDSVSKDLFDDKMKEFHCNNAGGTQSMWDRKKYEHVKSALIKGIKEGQPSKAYYYFKNTYQLYEVGESECSVVKISKKGDDNYIFMVPYEDCYDKLLEAHLQTGHGSRERMLYYIKSRWKITRSACEIFLSCCETCNLKKNEKRKGAVINPTVSHGFNEKGQKDLKNFQSCPDGNLKKNKKRKVVTNPIISHGFNVRGQISLIDFQSCPDGEYIWLLNYQDDATKFVQLRPLKYKQAANVADELSKIFFTFGAPSILQSDNGREFVAKVIDELKKLWPHCKIVHGRPRHSQSQDNIERANTEVENMLRTWMIDRKSTNWSQGCYEVQWMKNTSKYCILNRTPYEAVLGPTHCGLSSLSLPDNILNSLHTEEDLEKALAQLEKTVPTEQ